MKGSAGYVIFFSGDHHHRVHCRPRLPGGLPGRDRLSREGSTQEPFQLHRETAQRA